MRKIESKYNKNKPNLNKIMKNYYLNELITQKFFKNYDKK